LQLLYLFTFDMKPIKSNLVLENDVVLLEPLSLQHYNGIKRVAFAEPELFQFMTSSIFNEVELDAFFEQAFRDRDQGKSFPFAVLDKHTRTIIGSTRYGNINASHNSLEIGWTWISKQYHHHGINKAMKYLLLLHAFEVLEVDKVLFKVNALNVQSRKAIENIGGVEYETIQQELNTIKRHTVCFKIEASDWAGIKFFVFE
jgi:RimJ/RimL family protein N-acetyltransferase